MIDPTLFVPLRNVGKTKLVNNVVVIVSEAWSKQSLDVFKYEPLWLYVSNCPNRLWKHVAFIRVSQVLASDGKGLTWWAARYELDLTQLSDMAIQEVERFTKAHFQLDRAVERAEQLHYTRVVQQQFAAYYETPSETLARYFISQIPEKKNTQSVRAQFTPLIHQAFHQFVHELIMTRLTHQTRGWVPPAPSAMPATDTVSQDDRATDTKITTTEEEFRALYIIKALLRGRVAPKRITLRDRQTYCNVLLDDNQNKRLCVLHFNKSENKHLSLYDADKNEQKVPIQTLDDLYQFADELMAVVDRHESKT